MELNRTSQGNNNSSPSKYDCDQINEIINRLYEDYLHSNKSEIAHYHNIAIFIDFIAKELI